VVSGAGGWLNPENANAKEMIKRLEARD